MSEAPDHPVRVLGQDQTALQAYYRDLFGWKLDTGNQGGYGMTDAAVTGVTVGVGATPERLGWRRDRLHHGR